MNDILETSTFEALPPFIPERPVIPLAGRRPKRRLEIRFFHHHSNFNKKDAFP
ncbi:hypothetical protein [Brevibacillus sp. MS2.2]|uniref:hypothetical protein n=1 Tax=Brevibacillus sp. MS2.2 TaxID=2738981 RepID=UPI00156B3CEB|nr:hypothetical protein [Brevibacillus sp. MS2.2]NRR23283.1 hypothetical protein [Brevibacillus sp. MS2.2]